MSYGANLASHYRHAADYVDKILRGAKPGDIPVEQPTKFDLIVNLKAAKALGGVDSRDSLLGANQIQGCFWGGSLGCDGTVGFERRGVGADSAADHRPA
jgi:hypothetical protein